MHRRTGALSRAGRGPSSPPREDRAAGKKVRKNGRDRALLAMDEPYHKIVCLNSLICPGCEKKYFFNFSIKTRQLAVCSPFFAGSGACRDLGLSSGCLLKRTTKGNYGNFMKYFMQTGAHGGAPRQAGPARGPAPGERRRGGTGTRRPAKMVSRPCSLHHKKGAPLRGPLHEGMTDWRTRSCRRS